VNARFPEQLAAVRKLIADFPIGTKLDLTIKRGATAKTEPKVISVVTDKLESAITEERQISAWGLTVRELTRAYLRSKRLPPTTGVLVTGTSSGSAAVRAGIRQDDIIVRVNDKPVTSIDDLAAAVAEWEKDKKLVGVDVVRDRGQLPLSIRP
jgi:S1-C subfamily serine protease